MKYASQKVAYWFFATCMLLLCLQIVYGFVMAFAHAGFDVLHPIIPFHVARATHNNLLVVWLLCGFMGAAYFIIPEEADRELMWPTLAYAQLGALVASTVASATALPPAACWASADSLRPPATTGSLAFATGVGLPASTSNCSPKTRRSNFARAPIARLDCAG